MTHSRLSTEALTGVVQDQMARLSTALWVYDFDFQRVLWANAAALDVWKAETVDALRARDLGADMSPTVRARLDQYKIDLADPAVALKEIWTLYPDGQPQTLNVTYRGITLPDDRIAMLCEAVRDSQREPEALRSAEALLHTPVMISLYSTDGGTLYQNPAARASSTGPKQTLRARLVDAEQADDLLRRVADDGDIRMVARIATATGPRWHEISAQCRRDAVDGETVYLVSEIDVTDLKEAEERAGAADRAKSEFLANMSHEIRTPLNGVMGTAELLAMTELNPRQDEFVNVITGSGAALLTIINDILDISKLAAGQMKVESDPFDLRDLIDQIAALMAPNAAAKGIELMVRVDPVAPASLIGDAGRVRQVILNLVNNAVKFTETGTIFVDVGGDADPEDGSWRLQCSVTDTGTGIPAGQLKQVFEKFAQVDGSSTRIHEGTGLGLSICAMLIDLMAGTIDVESALGEGSVFRFEVPLPIHAGQVQEPILDRDLSGAHVLIVDDNAINRDILSELLAAWGVRSDTCNNGLEALAMMRTAVAARTPYAGVILDQQMPLMSGVDVMKVIQSDADISAVPVIMLTSVEHSGDGRSFEEHGAVAHLMKPVRSVQLREALVTHLLHANAPARPKQPESRTDNLRSFVEQVAAGHRAPPDGSVDVLICDDNPVNRRLIIEIIKMMNRTYASATNGIEAVQLYKDHRPGIILMDVSMPEMDGIEATAIIRQIEADSAAIATPIIAFTAHAIEGDQQRFLDSGMDDYIAKPVSAKATIEKIDLWLGTVKRGGRGAI